MFSPQPDGICNALNISCIIIIIWRNYSMELFVKYCHFSLICI